MVVILDYTLGNEFLTIAVLDELVEPSRGRRVSIKGYSFFFPSLLETKIGFRLDLTSSKEGLLYMQVIVVRSQPRHHLLGLGHIIVMRLHIP